MVIAFLWKVDWAPVWVTHSLKKNFFYSKIFTLEYCVHFCHSSIGISHGYTYVPSLLNPLPPTPPRLSQSPVWSFLCHTANHHWLSVSHIVAPMFPHYSLNSSPPFSFPHCVHRSVFDVYVSPAALQIGSAGHLSRFHMHALISLSCHSSLPQGLPPLEGRPVAWASLHSGS